MTNSTVRKFSLYICVLAVAAFFHLFFVPNMSPLFLCSGGDSSIFQEVGMAMLQGKTPYFDLFDHKGFLLYCIQFLGLLIHQGHYGLYLLSVINMVVFAVLWIKTTRLVLNRRDSVIAIGFTLIVYMMLHMKGNETEVWSLPYISYAIYLLTRYLIKGKEPSNKQCLLVGIGIGVISFIRLNNAAPVIFACIYFLIEMLREKDYKKLISRILYVLAGLVVVSLSSILLFGLCYGANHVYDMIYGTFIFNFEYARVWAQEQESILKAPFLMAVLVSLISIIVAFKDKQIKFAWIIVMGFVFSLLCMGKSYYSHYFAIIIPFFLLFAIFILSSNTYREFHYKKYLAVGCCLLLSCGLLIAKPYLTKKMDGIVYYEKGLREISDSLRTIPANELDSIWNYSGNFKGADVLRSINKVQMNRIILRLQYSVTDELKENHSLEEVRPLWIIVGLNYIHKNNEIKDSTFIMDNYEKQFTTNLEANPSSNIAFYRRIK